MMEPLRDMIFRVRKLKVSPKAILSRVEQSEYSRVEKNGVGDSVHKV